jgi:PBP1b-binding outer membrane lipoprotein LpoB
MKQSVAIAALLAFFLASCSKTEEPTAPAQQNSAPTAPAPGNAPPQGGAVQGGSAQNAPGSEPPPAQ